MISDAEKRMRADAERYRYLRHRMGTPEVKEISELTGKALDRSIDTLRGIEHGRQSRLR